MLCSSGETQPSEESWWTCLTLCEVGPLLHTSCTTAPWQRRAYRVARSGLLRLRSKLQLSWILWASPAPQAPVSSNPPPARKPSACEDSTALPNSPAGVNSVSLGKASYFSTADQTASSRNKLFLALGKSFLKKYDLPHIDEANYVRKIR